jgi:hypothetical protein
MPRLIPVIVTAAFAGCLFGILEPPSKPPTITGVITQVRTDESWGLRVLVEQEPDVPTGDKVYFAVSDATVLVQKADSSWQRGGLPDLRVGALVQVWDTGYILDSYPQQAEASVVAVMTPTGPSLDAAGQSIPARYSEN